jgi:hypothetical protein
MNPAGCCWLTRKKREVAKTYERDCNQGKRVTIGIHGFYCNVFNTEFLQSAAGFGYESGQCFDAFRLEK